jgi:hypothetical protein
MSFKAESGGGSIDPGIYAQVGDALKAGGLNSAAIQAVSAETQKLVDAAKSGGFKITPEAVGDMRKALAAMSEHLSELNSSTFELSIAPKLGDHPYGHAVAAHDQKGASDEANSVINVLNQFGLTIKQADEALQRAAGLYKEQEHQATTATATIKTMQV